MSLAKKINIDVKNALKAGDKKLLNVSRNVLSDLKNHLIKENLDRDVSKINNESFQRVIKTIIKQKKETKEYLIKVNDTVKIEIIDYDINYLESFMPKYLNEEETQVLITRYIADGNLKKKDFGKLMGLLKSNHANELDLSKTSKLITSLLK